MGCVTEAILLAVSNQFYVFTMSNVNEKSGGNFVASVIFVGVAGAAAYYAAHQDTFEKLRGTANNHGEAMGRIMKKCQADLAFFLTKVAESTRAAAQGAYVGLQERVHGIEERAVTWGERIWPFQ